MPRVALALLLLVAGRSAAAEAWSEGAPRAFVAGRIEAGLHGRLLLQAGWGKPHWAWAGAQGAALLTAGFVGAETSLRAALPFLDAQVALRETRSFDAPVLARSDAHAEEELSGGGSRLTVLDAGLSGVLPAAGGLAAWEVEWVRPLDLRDGAHVLEPVWHVAVGPSGAAALRLGWLAGPLLRRVRLGPFAEAVRLLRRDATVWRAGGALSASLGPHLSLVAMGLFPVDGPDRFHIRTATYGTLALRWSFATGDPAPGFR